jgi:type III restriction enzyme
LALGGLFDERPVAAGRRDLDADLAAVSPDWERAAVAAGAGSPGETSDDGPAGASIVEQVKQQAVVENRAFEDRARNAEPGAPPELEEKLNRHRIKPLFREEALALKLPQFFLKVQTGGWFDDDDALQLFEREELLKDFRLSQADATLSFEDADSEVYRVDLERIGDEDYAPRAFKLNVRERAHFNDYILGLTREAQVMNLVNRLAELIGNLYPITDQEVKRYLDRIVEGMSNEQLRDCLERDVAYVRKIKQKIGALADAHAQKAFIDLLDVDRIAVQPAFALPESITPSANASVVPKSLYVTEAAMGDFERRVINDIANLDSVEWWHRNLSRGKGFRINGYLNHYPDFIVKTKRGRLIVLETKGDDRDNSDSEMKLKLGKLWEAKAGSNFRYMMAFENNPIDGAERLSDALRKLEML